MKELFTSLSTSTKTLVFLSVAICLSIGYWLITQPTVDKPLDEPSATIPPIDKREDIEALKQQLSLLSNRLGEFENQQQWILTLSQQFTQLEKTQNNLKQELSALSQLQAEWMENMQQKVILPTSNTEEEVESQTSTHAVEIKDEMADFEHTFSQEVADPNWGLEIEATMSATLETLQLPNTVLDQVKCQQSACRIEFLHTEASDGENFIEAVHATEAFSGEFYTRSAVESNGQRRTLVYLARPGQSLF